MNIVKFVDKEIIGDDIYNEYFRGKYCWWINCKWAVSFDDLSTDEYIIASKLDSIGTGIEYLDVEEYQLYVDEVWTERINNQINVCKQLNDAVDEIPLDRLKVFRTWLAQSLIDLATDIDSDEFDSSGYGYEIDTMLNYYANAMTDTTVRAITNFATSDTVAAIIQSSCNCSTTMTSSIGTVLSSGSCNPLTMYRRGIYNTMVTTFSDVNFWIEKYEFCMLFKAHIDGIIKAGLSLTQTNDLSNLDYCDCRCAGNTQNELTKILNELSIALQYIIDEESSKHKNQIHSALYSWSSKLYENMYWV
jgi:hypothetical protein